MDKSENINFSSNDSMKPYAGKNYGAGRTGFAKHDGKMNHKMTSRIPKF